MTELWARIEPLLGLVQKPARYIGCEDGAVTPRYAVGKVSWLLAYPDTYEIGLPNQGLQILYEILNERGDAVAERTYAPWTDLDVLLTRHDIPLFSVETHRAAGEFDLLAFNLSSELVFTNVLQMIHLAGMPVRAEHRRPEHPLVVVGGHAAFNPEPLADFIDLVVLGEGEEVVGEITEVVGAWIRGGRADRDAVLRALTQIEGVYVPSMYEATYDGAALVAIEPRFPDVPATVDKRTVADLGEWPYPKRPLVPLTEVVHDRLSVEVFRGCTRGCRFCQAGMITRPVRERPADQVRTMVADGLRRTGYDEVSLTSLSTADYSDVTDVVAGILADRAIAAPGCATTVNLPSLRVDAFTVGLAGQVNSGRRSGLTFAPEAGSWRLRNVINKLITEEDLYGAVESAYAQGWSRMKLYFLTGLPTETDEDTVGIAELARNCVQLGQRHRGNRASVTVSVGGFVPKPHTPFQWFGQNTRDELQRKVNLLRTASHKMRNVNLKWHDPAASVAEGLLSPWRSAHRAGPRAGVARRRHLPGVGRTLPSRPVDRCDGRGGLVDGLVRLPSSHPRRPAAVVAPHRRSARGLPLGRLASGVGRQWARGLSVDTVLRLRCLHGLRHRARGLVQRRPGGRQPGHRSGSRPRWATSSRRRGHRGGRARDVGTS